MVWKKFSLFDWKCAAAFLDHANTLVEVRGSCGHLVLHALYDKGCSEI